MKYHWLYIDYGGIETQRKPMGHTSNQFIINSSGRKVKPTLHFIQDTPGAAALGWGTMYKYI